MIPERFIVVCPEGHIDDFPVAEWLHFDSGHTYNPSTCKIRRSTGGTSASLSGVRYYCSCGASKSISGALLPNALEKIGYHCKGGKPWLGIEEDTESPCTCDSKQLKAVQRGASNIWFAHTVSSIHIPTDSDDVTREIATIVNNRDYLDLFMSSSLHGDLPRDLITMIAQQRGVDPDALYNAFYEKINNVEAESAGSKELSEDEYRLAEYKILVKNSGSDVLDFHSVNKRIDEYDRSLIQ